MDKNIYSKLKPYFLATMIFGSFIGLDRIVSNNIGLKIYPTKNSPLHIILLRDENKDGIPELAQDVHTSFGPVLARIIESRKPTNSEIEYYKINNPSVKQFIKYQGRSIF